MDGGVCEADQFGTGGMVLETSRHMRDVMLALQTFSAPRNARPA
jgi:hypothetical protein